jgi:hypothetical protein
MLTQSRKGAKSRGRAESHMFLASRGIIGGRTPDLRRCQPQTAPMNPEVNWHLPLRLCVRFSVRPTWELRRQSCCRATPEVH